MASLEEEEQLRLALEGPTSCSTDELEAFMKSLEDTFPSCCGSTLDADLEDDVLSSVRTRDKADSISSETSSASGGEGSPPSSCTEQECGKGSEEEEGEPEDNWNKISTEMSIESQSKESQMSATSSSDNSNPSSSHSMTMRKRTARDYNLRNSSIINRIQTEQRRSQPKQPKPKTAPPPLSKYRRRTANSRERSRMKEINDAFEELRQSIPSYPIEPTGIKLTKITTLRMALNYICALRDMLGYTNPQISDSTVSTAGIADGFHGSPVAGCTNSGSQAGGSSEIDSPQIPFSASSSSMVSPSHSDISMDIHHLSPEQCFGLTNSEEESMIS